MVRLGNTACRPETWDKQKPFYYNEEFQCISGHEWFKGGELSFPPCRPGLENRRDSSYKTAFGPSFDHNGQMFAETDKNISLAFRRMSALREPPKSWRPTEPEHERYISWTTHLTSNQKKFLSAHKDLLDTIAAQYTPYFHDYLGAELEADVHHADTHKKKQERIGGYTELVHTATLHKRLWLNFVVYKMKKMEWGKPGKYPRMIGDLGVEASLQGFRTTEFLKIAESSEPIKIRAVTIAFIKAPKQAILREVFETLIDPPERGYFCYFSDDSCFSIRVNGYVYTFNVDISSCDSSHTPAIFKALKRRTPVVAQSDVEDLIQQLRCDIVIRSVEHKKKSVKLRSRKQKNKTKRKPHLYSGSTLTTTTNNLASQMIAVAFSEADFSGCYTYAQVEEVLIAAAEAVGYGITTQQCIDYSHIQFLKHSPVFDSTGRLHPILNLGVLLRISGVCVRDLPGRGSVSVRAAQFQSALLRGAYPRTSFPMLDSMKAACTSPEVTDQRQKGQIARLIADVTNYKQDSDPSDECFTVTSDEVFRRYVHLCYNHDFDELLQDVARSAFGDVISSPAASAILSMDYGLTCNTE